MVTAGLNATPTATPFMPAASTAIENPVIYSSTQTAAPDEPWGTYPGPTIWPPLPIPPPVGILPQPSGQTTILLMGSDQRPYDGGFRTDVNLLLTINTEQGIVSLTSFPRDLYVYIPGWTMERINTAQIHGGFPASALTFEYNFGVRPDHWALINFTGFQNIINALGGIYVDVAWPLTDHRDGYGQYSVPAGSVYMDGETALWYVRSRGTSNDFDRTRRQQEVLQAIFFRGLSLDGIQRAPELYEQFIHAVQTDLTLGDILPLLPIAAQFTDTSRIHRYAISVAQITPWVNPNTGAQVLLPNRELILEIMYQALNIQ